MVLNLYDDTNMPNLDIIYAINYRQTPKVKKLQFFNQVWGRIRHPPPPFVAKNYPIKRPNLNVKKYYLYLRHLVVERGKRHP